MQDCDLPAALSLAEIPGVVHEYAHAARLARAAGFDGVELHAASGYLPMQFLSTGTNQRTDAYGGSLHNRIRFVLETLDVMIAAAGDPARVAMKISPAIPFNDIHDDEPIETYTALVKAVAPMGLGYLHVLRTPPLPQIFDVLRPLYPGTFAAGGGFDFASGNAAVASGLADFVVFGKPFTSNPDLAERFAAGLALTPFDAATFYTPGAKGYTDFPPAAAQSA
jgi:N-ethylmaleimide reductase